MSSLSVFQKKEYFRLQAFLSYLFAKPESDMIRDIFTMYDRDQSGKKASLKAYDCIYMPAWPQMHVTGLAQCQFQLSQNS